MPAPEPWYAMPVLTGSLIRLEPLDYEHAPGYLAAAGSDGEDVFRWLNSPGSASGAPRSLADAELDIADAVAARAGGRRLAYAQIDVATGEFAGSSSYYDIVPHLRTLGIGHTWLGTRWWRSGHNADSKLLMLTHAFETLGAVRVVWHTDIYNERSQAAIAGLGATREGELRKHRIRRDGSWRTTVQYSMIDDDWPAARAKLTGRLARAV